MRLNQRQARSGFTLIELMIVILGVSVLVMMLLPRHTGHKVKATKINCTNNLKQIGLAYRQWAIDHNEQFPAAVPLTNGGAMEAVMAGNVAAVFQVMSNELNTPKILFCPADKRRMSTTLFAPGLGNSNVNYFVGLDASPASPQMFLSGDDNLLVGGPVGGYGVAIKGAPVKPGVLALWTNTPVAWSDGRHKKQGNVGLADGSVQGFSSNRLLEGLRNTGAATNRLAFP
jgi:prepilin-type N-terminal cleavage/methylation domain-containing protein/prepilin-type processing-associated H-X9-DG protein